MDNAYIAAEVSYLPLGEEHRTIVSVEFFEVKIPELLRDIMATSELLGA
jgi:hypothetical protein